MTRARTPLVWFLVVSLIWGGTWAAIRLGLQDLPPVFLAAVRYLLVGLVLVAIGRWPSALLQGGSWSRIFASALLVNTGTYGLLFWGMQTVPSGISALLNLSLIPIALFVLAIATGEEQPSWRHAGAIAVGLSGLMTLFWGRLGDNEVGSPAGLAAIVAGTMCYCTGSVMSRPLLKEHGAIELTCVQAVVGGAALLIIAVLIEPVSASTVAALLKPQALGCLAFLSLAGTIVAYTLYLRLIETWGTARAGLYAFVSPVVALALGKLLFGEVIGLREILGAALMLGAAALAIRKQKLGIKTGHRLRCAQQ